MLIFLWTMTFIWMQLECLVNGYKIPMINISTTGLPMVVAIGFYILKIVANEYRSMQAIEKDMKENPEHYE